MPVTKEMPEELKITILRTDQDLEETFGREGLIDFLFVHLGKYGDSREAIENSIDYAFSNEKGKGGFILVAQDQDEIVGALVINDTGMEGYIPEHVLVYVAVHEDTRGLGIGGMLIESAKELCDGNIALHVEKDNPARNLYKKLGFDESYLEMRYKE
ncbi:MAG: Acetyltransferase [Thermotogales bacterium 46_20]|nr:MAG: Acetyltransferase [Thermotogales bacterium 46_20]